MAQQPQPQYEFRYQRVELLKTEELGVGSYGAVCKAMCDNLHCAAKILHRTLFQFTAPGTTSAMRKFEQECRLLSAIKHPHIVQYLGTYHDPESRLPVLLMELMDESLTRFLEQSNEPLSYHTEVNVCHDIVLALSYLHSNGIIHRDLSSNNVLLIAGSRAKVTDFGMAKLYDVNRSTAHVTPLTLCPGTMAYMSPEALGEPPMYTDKLDSFSLGVICVQIMTRQFPDPGNRFKIIEINDPRAPSGRAQAEVPETERRQSHIDLIDPAHPLLPVALNCLKDRDRERPSCHELCGHMSTLKASPKYTESVQQSRVNTKPTQNTNRESRERDIQQSQQVRDLQQQLYIKDDQLHTKDHQLQDKERENQQQRQQILGLRTLLTAKDGQLAGKDHQIQQKEEAIATHQQEVWQLRQQLQSSEQVAAEFQQNLLERKKMIQDLQRQVLELQQQLHTKDDQLQEKEQENQQQILELRTLLTAKDEQLAGKDDQLAGKDEQLASKDHQIQQKEVTIATHHQEILQLRQKLQSSEQVAAEFQQNLLEREKMIQDLQRQVLELQQLRQRECQRREEGEASGAAASGGSIKLRWRYGGRASCEMVGEVSVVDGSVAYFRPVGSKSVFAYNSTNNKWSELLGCPNSGFSLAMVNGLLTAIGGRASKYELTNSLLSLTDNKWTKQFPPMPTKRWLTVVVCSGRSLVVAGGVGKGGKSLSTVEVMDTETLQWSTASSLPHPLYQASATLCGDQVYMLGGFDQSGKLSKSVFTCSLTALIQSCQPQSLGERLKTLSLASKPEVWHQLADTPYPLSTCASLHGRVLAVGGTDSDGKKTTVIHMYNTTNNSREVISHMTTPRCRCLVAVLPHNELMVVGGFIAGGDKTDSVEIASIV